MTTIARHIAAIADRFEDDFDAVEAEIDAAIERAIPAFGDDPGIRGELRASTLGNLRRFLAAARNADETPLQNVPPEATDIARTLVRRGIDVEAVYEGYRLGQQTIWRRWTELAGTVVDPPSDLPGVLDVSLGALFDYANEAIGRVIEAMQHERDAIAGGDLARRTETVRLLLDGAPLDQKVGSRRLRYDLGRHHTALVLWTEGGDSAQGSLEFIALGIARQLPAPRPLTLSVGDGVLWAWLATPTAVDPTRVASLMPGDAPTVRLAVGPSHPGITGFRVSHEGAVSVYRLLAGNRAGVKSATYQDLEVTALAAHDPARARDFVSRTLGVLTEETASAARLRETLRIFLEEGESAPRAAKRLHTHRNTVLQRVARAQELLGYRPGDRRLAVELALELRRWLPNGSPGPIPVTD